MDQIAGVEMLGVRRASVSTVAMRFKRARLIRYDRGVVRVLDRPGLETSSCESYATMRQATNQVFDTGEEPGADPAARERLRRRDGLKENRGQKTG